VISLPPASQAGTVRIIGEFVPTLPQDVTVRGPVGLVVSLGGTPVWKNAAIAPGPFEVSFELPAGDVAGFSTVELRILGVGRSNFLAWLGRKTKSLPLPRGLRSTLQRFRKQPKNRQIS
jgi:hypothetical protein